MLFHEQNLSILKDRDSQQGFADSAGSKALALSRRRRNSKQLVVGDASVGILWRPKSYLAFD